jgi:hypothetical protein
VSLGSADQRRTRGLHSPGSRQALATLSVPGAGGRKAVSSSEGGLGWVLTKWRMVVSFAVQRRRLSAEGGMAAGVGTWKGSRNGHEAAVCQGRHLALVCCFDWSLSLPLVRVARRRELFLARANDGVPRPILGEPVTRGRPPSPPV